MSGWINLTARRRQSTVRHPTFGVGSFAMIKPSVPSVKAMSGIDQIGTFTIHINFIILESITRHVAVVVLFESGLSAPVVVIDLEKSVIPTAIAVDGSDGI